MNKGKYSLFIEEWTKEQIEKGIADPNIEDFPKSSMAWATWKTYKHHIKNIKKSYKKNPEPVKQRVRDWKALHPIKEKRTDKQYREKHRDKMKKYLKDYRENTKTRPKLLRSKKEYYKNNFDVISRKAKRRYKDNPEIAIRRAIEYREKTDHVVKAEILIHYSDSNKPRCKCCHEKIIEFLTIEHPNGRNEKIRRTGNKLYRWLKKEKFPKGIEVLCWNCNCSKGFYGICSHKKQYEYKNDYSGRNKKEVFEHYSKGKPKCFCCGESNIGFLSMDHIKNIGKKQRPERIYSWIINHNFPKGFRVLCFNCNSGRNLTYNKTCPHKIK